jgi:uncharacterized protein with NRDE domain
MCLIVLAYQVDPQHPLIVAANRDEFYRRLSDPIGFWATQGDLLAGRDLLRGGVWLGVTRGGRFAAVTNIREGLVRKRFPVSRGDLAKGFLTGNLSPAQYVKTLREPHLYGGFHLLLGDSEGLFHFSNRTGSIRALEPGIHGISNHLFDDSWPKTEISKLGLGSLIERGQVDHQRLQALMAQQPLKSRKADSNLEYAEQNPFLWSREYGTCASSSLIIKRDNLGKPSASICEKRYRQLGIETGNRCFEFELSV